MRKSLIVAAAIAMPFTATAALADGHEAKADEPEMLDQDWYRINLVQFKPDADRGRIGEIIDMFMQANKDAGTDGPVMVHMNSGPWNMMVFFKMQHGIAQMGWTGTPEGDKWDAAFEALAGGKDGARAIFREFDSYIAKREAHIGHIHDDGEDE